MPAGEHDSTGQDNVKGLGWELVGMVLAIPRKSINFVKLHRLIFCVILDLELKFKHQKGHYDEEK